MIKVKDPVKLIDIEYIIVKPASDYFYIIVNFAHKMSSKSMIYLVQDSCYRDVFTAHYNKRKLKTEYARVYKNMINFISTA